MERELTRRDFFKESLKEGLRWGVPICSLPVLFRTTYSHATKAAEVLQEARHYEKLSGNRVRCHLCFRGCEIAEGKRGFCRNRENLKGALQKRGRFYFIQKFRVTH